MIEGERDAAGPVALERALRQAIDRAVGARPSAAVAVLDVKEIFRRLAEAIVFDSFLADGRDPSCESMADWRDRTSQLTVLPVFALVTAIDPAEVVAHDAWLRSSEAVEELSYKGALEELAESLFTGLYPATSLRRVRPITVVWATHRAGSRPTKSSRPRTPISVGA